MRSFFWIAMIASAASIALAVSARVPTYRVAPAFIIPILWAIVLLRRPLHLRASHFALVASAILLHNLGALGYYQQWPMRLSFDIVVHFWFAFAAMFVVYRWLRIELPLRAWGLRLGSVLMIMGGGALHEITEYASYLLLGEERGMLKPQTSYFFDTQRDLTSNLAGCVAALVVIAMVGSGGRRANRPR